MRTKEIEKIQYLRYSIRNLNVQTAGVAKKFSFYRQIMKELNTKSETLYNQYLKENEDSKRVTIAKRFSKRNAILAALKLKHVAVLHSISKKNKEQFPFAKYTYSDFSRPEETTRQDRFYEVLTAAWAVKNPAPFGLTKKEVSEAANTINEYLKQSDRPLKRKKEKAQLAKECRKMLSEIDSIIYSQIQPFFENIKDKYRNEALSFSSLLKPTKIGRPANKKVKKKNSISLMSHSY